jgi:hypothetical protein
MPRERNEDGLLLSLLALLKLDDEHLLIGVHALCLGNGLKLNETTQENSKRQAKLGYHELPKTLVWVVDAFDALRTVYTKDYCGTSETFACTRDPQQDVCGLPLLYDLLLSSDC